MEKPSLGTSLASIAGAVAVITQAILVSMPAMKAADTNREARAENVTELRRCIAEREEFKKEWKVCMEESP